MTCRSLSLAPTRVGSLDKIADHGMQPLSVLAPSVGLLLAPDDALVNGLAPGKSLAGAVPMADSLLAQFPAQQDNFFPDNAGEIEQTDVKVLHLHSRGVDLRNGVLGTLDGFLALILAFGDREDVHECTAVNKDAALQRLEFGVDLFDERLRVHCRAQQRFENGQKSLSFRKCKCAWHIDGYLTGFFLSDDLMAVNHAAAVFPKIGPMARNTPLKLLPGTPAL